MADTAHEWSSNANDAVRVSLVQSSPNGLKTLSTFHPKFTYPIFGEEERIFGYQDLDLHLRFAAHDLRPNLEISYSKKFPAIGDTRALDLNKTLKEWTPSSAFRRPSDFEKVIKDDTAAKDFKPPGKLVHTYSRKGRSFEIWSGSLSDAAVRDILDRIQIFISFFIEGGTPLNTDDVDWTVERWTVYYIYEKLAEVTDPSVAPYSLVGYATTYRFYTFSPPPKSTQKPAISTTPFPEPSPISVSELDSRLRISQFLILPPHQRYGHGSELYNAIYNIALSDPTILELTVEDPNEEFDLIRDLNDYARLSPELSNANLSINSQPFPPTQKRAPKRVPTSSLLPIPLLNTLRHKYKIAPRQFSRLTELYLLSKIPRTSRAMGGANLTKLMVQKWKTPKEEDKVYYWWRMLVKQRVYKKNRDTLIQLEVEDRLSKLEETVQMQEGEYELILLAIEDRRKKLEGKKEENGDGDGGASARKRKTIVDEDEDEDGDGDGDGNGEDEGGSEPKRVRV